MSYKLPYNFKIH